MISQKEKNNRVIAAGSTIGFYAVLFLILIFTVAWTTPDPPIPGGGGVELILGTDDQGFGDLPDDPIGSELPEQNKEEQKVAPEPEPVKEEPKQAEPEPDDKEVVTSEEESPVTVKKEDPKKKEEPKKTEPVKPVENPVKDTPKKEELPKTTFDPNKKKSTTDNKEGTPGNKGDDPGTTGDKGDPNGLPRGQAFEGKAGTGGSGKGGSGEGVSLDMSGWDWVDKPVAPKPTEQDSYSGYVTFEFSVNDIGEVGRVQKIAGNLTFDLEKKCKESLEKTAFYKTSDGDAPAKTIGRITFRLKVQ